VAQLVQSLATMWFPHSTKHPYPILQVEVVTKPTQVSLCLSPKLATQFEKYLLFAILNTIVINYIIPPKDPIDVMVSLLNEQMFYASQLL
jgi:hypothetical protein